MSTVAAEQRTRWGVVAIGFACGIAGMFQTAKMSVALVDIQRDIGLSLVGASWSVTAVSLTGALFGIQAGRISAEFGVARTLIFALVLSAVAGFTTAVLSDPVLFLASRLLEGVGYLLVCTAAPAMMALNAAPRDRGLALAIWGAFVPISVSLMSFFGPPVLLAFGWRALFVASAATTLVMALLVVATVRDGPLAPGTAGGRIASVVREIPRDAVRLYGSSPSLGLGVAFMAFAATQVGFIALQPTFLVEARGLDIVTVGLVLTATTPFAILGTIIAGVVQRLRLADVPAAVGAFVGIAAFGTAALTVEPKLLPLILTGAAFFTAGGVVAAVVFASVPKRTTDTEGLALLSGLIVQFGNLGALLGAPIFAGVAVTFGWSTVPVALAALVAIGIAGMVVSGRGVRAV